MDAIRIGFVGLGGICRQRHVPGFQRIDGVELAAVANRSRGSSERAAAEFDIPVVCDSWEDLVARDDIDAVVIGTWPYMHCPITLAALDAGKHVFCQARMAMDYAEAQQMYDAAQNSDRVAVLCPVPFGLSIDATVRRRLKQHDLGDIRLVRVQSLGNAFAHQDVPMNWRKDHRLSGLNVHTLGMYVEVIHRWFGWTGSVSAQTHTFTKKRIDTNDERVAVEIPDQVLVHAMMGSGIPVEYCFSSVVQHGSDEIFIHGTKGTLYYDVTMDHLCFAREGEAMGSATIAMEDKYDVACWPVEQQFVDAIRTGAEYHPNFEDGLRYMQVIQAVYESAEQGRVVELV